MSGRQMAGEQSIINKENVLRVLFDTVQRVKHDRFIIGKSGKYGVADESGNIVIPVKYSRITNSEVFFRVYGEVIGVYSSWNAVYYTKENGVFNMDGKEIVPLGNYPKTCNVPSFGLSLHSETKTILVSNKEKVIELDTKDFPKLAATGIPGYAFLLGCYDPGRSQSGIKYFDNREILGIYDLNLNKYDSLFHTYSSLNGEEAKVEKIGVGVYKVYRDNTYIITDYIGAPMSGQWIDCNNSNES